MPPSFRLPKFADAYVAQVIERSENLIAHQIWAGIPTNRLRAWLRQFQTDEQKYLSACLLDSLIYRSDSQSEAIAKQLFQRTLPDLTRRHPLPIPQLDDWRTPLHRDSASVDPQIRLVAVISPDDPPTKSAFIVTRLLKRQLALSENWIINPQDIPSAVSGGVKVLLFVDDFLGTGHQFEGFANALNLRSLFATTFCIYAPLLPTARTMRRQS